MQESINPWKTLNSTEIYDNPWIKLTEHRVINPSGGNGIYGVVSFKNYAIGIVPIDGEGNIWLVGQYRYATNGYSWELPEGGGPLGVDPLESAKRELLEETGLKAETWSLVQELHLSNSVSDEKAFVYLAQGLTQHEAEPEETEQLSIKKIHFNDAFNMVMTGEITDSITVAAILKIKHLLF
ncbi:NUDIX domain-containing protein [Solitalea canadensis]|uniref:GDP-mannose pyrophosphatase n=1 Tax=Solitalea canadensis (strain ATCC 29591 / DSM 3403 / JCM 21819 / LMG 8368 / NBRC 15130 / NCIMB 12057 / USAM 9D) TaxID=929556 RepID=H8KMF8_SOLCM|nr:NUDIX hydrolase [Solitalea canadensis]AFD08753.1 NTP pyrophosphohydrolase [Solitalea canadensis DSM 3403]